MEKYARRINSTSTSSSPWSHRSVSQDIANYHHLADIMRAYLETNHGRTGTDEQRAQFHSLIRSLLSSKECLDFAALAFFASLDSSVLTNDLQDKVHRFVRRRMSSPRYSHDELRLDDTYVKFVSDAHEHKTMAKYNEISVLDVDRFAYKWLSHYKHNIPAFAYHWVIPNLDLVSKDLLSEVFEIHGIKCRLRFRKEYPLTNGETWTSMWLHNVSTGCKVVSTKFALVMSNTAYPTINHVEAIKPNEGIRPSQGVGVKLFARIDDLVRQKNGNLHPIIQYNGLRLSVIYY
ncbi:hypothetical protein GGI07_002552 [Coemansia sp. Benny D115]|nr:hypothetical protein GGI07_002552 [Coemansia sp. Benny D115]